MGAASGGPAAAADSASDGEERKLPRPDFAQMAPYKPKQYWVPGEHPIPGQNISILSHTLISSSSFVNLHMTFCKDIFDSLESYAMIVTPVKLYATLPRHF